MDAHWRSGVEVGVVQGIELQSLPDLGHTYSQGIIEINEGKLFLLAFVASLCEILLAEDEDIVHIDTIINVTLNVQVLLLSQVLWQSREDIPQLKEDGIRTICRIRMIGGEELKTSSEQLTDASDLSFIKRLWLAAQAGTFSLSLGASFLGQLISRRLESIGLRHILSHPNSTHLSEVIRQVGGVLVQDIGEIRADLIVVVVVEGSDALEEGEAGLIVLGIEILIDLVEVETISDVS